MLNQEEDKLKLTIGLEIHLELKTHTKMFCDCLNDPDETHPNVNICPICVGHPGTLPVINKVAVEKVLQVGAALGGKLFLKNKAKFDRKNYFYPDLPKGYQISEYDEPLVEGGELLGIRIRRVHLEEDAGRLIHTKIDSLVDYNRAGVPLMELVTEPDITSAKQAVNFTKELKLIFRYLDVSDADMEKGQLRLEANISLNFGIKVEVKNINSFKALEEAINYEFKRQENLIKQNKKVVHETRGWNDSDKKTVAQRSKEEAQDYRYFPEPDLPTMNEKAFDFKKIKLSIPELPLAKKERFQKEFALSEAQADLLIQDHNQADYFEQAASELDNEIGNDSNSSQLLFNYLISDLRGLMKSNGIDNVFQTKIKPDYLAHLIILLFKKEITSRMGKDLLNKIFQSGLDPHEVIKNEEWHSVSDLSLLRPLIDKVIKENPQAVADYKKGKQAALQFLIGKSMAELKGRGDPNVLEKLIVDLLS